MRGKGICFFPSVGIFFSRSSPEDDEDADDERDFFEIACLRPEIFPSLRPISLCLPRFSSSSSSEASRRLGTGDSGSALWRLSSTVLSAASSGDEDGFILFGAATGEPRLLRSDSDREGCFRLSSTAGDGLLVLDAGGDGLLFLSATGDGESFFLLSTGGDDFSSRLFSCTGEDEGWRLRATGEASGLFLLSTAGDLSAGDGDGLILRFSAGDGERRDLPGLVWGDFLGRGGDLTGESSPDEDESLFLGEGAFFPRLTGDLSGLPLLSLAELFFGCSFSFGGVTFFFLAGDGLPSSDEDDPSLEEEEALLFATGALRSRLACSWGDDDRFPVLARALSPPGLAEPSGLRCFGRSTRRGGGGVEERRRAGLDTGEGECRLLGGGGEAALLGDAPLRGDGWRLALTGDSDALRRWLA